MNALFAELGWEGWKPVVAALLLPPVPLMLLALVGTRMVAWRRGPGWLVVLLAMAGLWLAHCAAVGEWLMRSVLEPAPPLGATARAALRDAARTRSTAVVVLGGGRESLAPEYGLPSLGAYSLERLRYGLWLGRELGVPVGFTGGVGHAQRDGPPEAEVAARIAAQEFGHRLRWAESRSRDTRENALHTMSLLEGEGISRVVLVTHAWHMPRARRAFDDAARQARLNVEILPAPIAWAPRVEHPVLQWMPTWEGSTLVRQTLREAIGLLAGA